MIYVLAIALKPSRTPAKGFSPSSMSQNPKITNVIWSLQSSEGVRFFWHTLFAYSVVDF
jgi:hypothetical protein